jgi:hypothetical protein
MVGQVGLEYFFPKFCSWSADDQHFACSGYRLVGNDEGESAIFLMNRSTGMTKYLTMTHELPGDSPYYGQSHLQFAGNKTTILFDSDRLIGSVRRSQVYKATYPSTWLP